MSNSFAAIGTVFQKKNTTDVSYVHIAEVISINWANVKLDLIDVTNMDSTGFYREFLPTLFDGGEISFELNYLPQDATQQALKTDYDARTLLNMQLVLPSSLGTWSFTGYIQEMGKVLEIDKQAKQSVKVKVTGKPTFA
ncbi:MAG TPA: phage tail tube protein [Candidatus Angelobacter sp.]|nr:phage tail tube protein [Candidatus Angelobacter sp.]